ncbi:MAG: hypothetical protein M0Z48_00445 [Nitrospiraceae bacterium]|nr:hypothetical protein [Nitrospiraceae bacterium]
MKPKMSYCPLSRELCEHSNVQRMARVLLGANYVYACRLVGMLVKDLKKCPEGRGAVSAPEGGSNAE